MTFYYRGFQQAFTLALSGWAYSVSLLFHYFVIPIPAGILMKKLSYKQSYHRAFVCCWHHYSGLPLR